MGPDYPRRTKYVSCPTTSGSSEKMIIFGHATFGDPIYPRRGLTASSAAGSAILDGPFRTRPMGYILGGYTDAASKPDIGKFTLTLRKGSDGRWLIMSDMDNANQRS